MPIFIWNNGSCCPVFFLKLLEYEVIKKAKAIENKIENKNIVEPSKKIGSFFWKNGDIGVIDKFGPNVISKLVKMISNKTGRLQTGFIYDYAFVMLLGLSILLTYLILK